MTAKIRWTAAEDGGSRSRQSYAPVSLCPQALPDRRRAAILRPDEGKQRIRLPEESMVYRTAFLPISDRTGGTPRKPDSRRFKRPLPLDEPALREDMSRLPRPALMTRWPPILAFAALR